MSKKNQSSKQGFTIIEVLIVLAIAGLILLIVFLAVPALQRNSRNTAYRNEANALMAAVNEISGNQGGSNLDAGTWTKGDAVPASSDANYDAYRVMNAANTSNIQTIKIQANPATGTLLGDVTAIALGAAPTANQITVETVILRTRARCDTADDGVPAAHSSLRGTTRQLALYFATEVAGTDVPVPQCVQS